MQASQKIVVVGGTGLIGSKVVALLQTSGHDVVVAAPATGVNSITGEGLAQALNGAHAVIDVSNAPSYDPAVVKSFFETSGRNIAAAEAVAKVKHHVTLSIVGVDRMPDNGYFQGKIAQEAIVTSAGTPYTIVRATQFMEFLTGIADSSVVEGKIHLSPGLFQPIAADDVAAFLADIATGAPANGVVEVAGPERAPLADIVGRHLALTNDARVVERDPQAKYFGGTVTEESLVPLGQARLGTTTHGSWLQRQKAVH
ncbi:SDR family oxidoreductase [Achromobacter spanius]|jgi:uncharacterized protein YbjT (DUF2867 family)|uniref:SDR family oxidoreductase n=1 Tax=Achromobacter spanius TaxID=217203 RepID=A0AA42LTZ3_9BURK|nr:SDR family oxidoreductase [Achromobacter spanius]MDH0739533.1 SDR family oxidoreductase [Achromobacter spanius]